MEAADGPARWWRNKAMAFAYLLPRAESHRIRDMPSVAGVSEATARRRVDELAGMGLAVRRKGAFTVHHDAICQPIEVLDAMRPSLLALGRARASAAAAAAARESRLQGGACRPDRSSPSTILSPG